MMIPASLRAERRWIVAKLETVNGRLTKVPYCAFDVSRKASSVDPATWADYTTVDRAVRSDARLMLGFVLGGGFVGVDLDHCVTSGIVEPWAVRVIDVIDSYTEFSVSKTGVHILCRGSLPAGGNRRTGKAGKYPPVPAGSELEAYDDGRYFVVTGDTIRASALEDRTDVLAAVNRAIFGLSTRARYEHERDAALAALGVDPNDQRGKENITAADVPRTFSDEEVLLFAARAANSDKFLSLWRGELSAYGGDHSSADLALASILMFYTRGDREQADRLFRLSKLSRDKWTKRADYRRRTFDKADQS